MMLQDPGPARGEGDPGGPLRLLPPTSYCGRSLLRGLQGCQQELSSSRQQGNHRSVGPASPGTWAGRQTAMSRWLEAFGGCSASLKLAVCKNLRFFSPFYSWENGGTSRVMLLATPVLTASLLAQEGNLQLLETCRGCCRGPKSGTFPNLPPNQS